MANSRDSYNLKKIQKFNKIDQTYDKDSLKQMIIKPEKIEKPNLNIENLIKNRESDFKQFILPQKDNSDVIIKFFTIDDIDLQNLDVNPKLSLELLIDKSFNIKHILKKLSDNKIEFDLQDENRFNKITFLNYKKLIFFDINNDYTFYDYILYFILNLNYNS